MKVGDWVSTCSKGYFRIEKLVKRFFDESHRGSVLNDNFSIGDEMPEPMAVLKKGFTASLKPHVGWDTCVLSLCRKVDDDTLQMIYGALSENEKFNRRFENYSVPPIKTIHNVGIKLSDSMAGKIAGMQNEIVGGMTFLEITQWLDSDLKFAYPHNGVIQMINHDFEINQRNQMIFREIRIC